MLEVVEVEHLEIDGLGADGGERLRAGPPPRRGCRPRRWRAARRACGRCWRPGAPPRPRRRRSTRPGRPTGAASPGSRPRVVAGGAHPAELGLGVGERREGKVELVGVGGGEARRPLRRRRPPTMSGGCGCWTGLGRAGAVAAGGSGGRRSRTSRRPASSQSPVRMANCSSRRSKRSPSGGKGTP